MNQEYVNGFYKKVLCNLDERDLNFYLDIFSRFIVFMKDSNKISNRECEYFSFIFRESNYSDDTMSPYVFEMKWGDKNEN